MTITNIFTATLHSKLKFTWSHTFVKETTQTAPLPYMEYCREVETCRALHAGRTLREKNRRYCRYGDKDIETIRNTNLAPPVSLSYCKYISTNNYVTSCTFKANRPIFCFFVFVCSFFFLFQYPHLPKPHIFQRLRSCEIGLLPMYGSS